MFDVLSALPSSPQSLWPSPNSSLLLGLCTHCQSTCLDPRWASPYSALHGACYLTASGLTELPKPMVCDLLYPLDPFRSFSLIFEVKSGQNSMYQPVVPTSNCYGLQCIHLFSIVFDQNFLGSGPVHALDIFSWTILLCVQHDAS